MAYNKVDADGRTLIDLTSDTVTADTLVSGRTAHLASGERIIGTFEPVTGIKGNAESTYRKGDVNLTPANLGLGNVNNTSDLDKPISTATQAALDAQQAQIDDNSEISETPDTTPYLYKASEHDALYDELVGGSVVWNQLVANSGSSLSVTITSGHKYAMKKSGILSVGASSGSAITGFTGGTDWITDLTLMFGTTIADYVYSLEQSTAGSGIVWLKSYGFFTKDYYAYNAGTLTSVNVSGKKVVSETTEITYPIQSTDLRGLYKLNGNNLYTDGDIYSADGTVTRKYGIVDLGTLKWTYYSGNQLFYADSPTDSIEIISGGHPCICSKYPYVIKTTSLPDKTLLFNSASISVQKRIHIRDSSYTDAATFKTAMSGVYLIYELATPTTETAQPFASPQIVYRNGTEEYLDTRDVPIPVGGNRKYVDIPEWMVNEYFDDLRISAYELTQDLDDISGELDCLTIRAALVNNEVIIQNTSDFTSELYSKYFSLTKPKFAILKLQITSNTHYYKALINSLSVSQGNLMEASFMTMATGEYIYNFTWLRTVTVGTPTVTRKALNLGS